MVRLDADWVVGESNRPNSLADIRLWCLWFLENEAVDVAMGCCLRCASRGGNARVERN